MPKQRYMKNHTVHSIQRAVKGQTNGLSSSSAGSRMLTKTGTVPFSSPAASYPRIQGLNTLKPGYAY